jgi:hypothetical protein
LDLLSLRYAAVQYARVAETMTAITFDTLAYAKRLQQAGVSAEQAEVQAEALRDVVDENLGGCRVMGDRSEGVGERGQFSPYSRRIVGLCNENTGKTGPLSHLRSRFIHNPAASCTKQDIALLQRDIKELELTLRRDIAEMKFDALKWLIGLLAVQTGLIIAVFKLLA